MRDDAFAVLRRVGVETGGSNVQFAVDPATGERLVIEMNPRVSRSSALASKATGFPIAKIATRLAVGYRLDEITNDITKATPASFEPVIDYVVTKVPRWQFEKLPGAEPRLGTRMQSVGEVMAIGRTFTESLQKALRSLEQGRDGLNADAVEASSPVRSTDELLERVTVASPDRVFELEVLLRRGVPIATLAQVTGIDPWFLQGLAAVADARTELEAIEDGSDPLGALGADGLRRMKRLGFSDAQLGHLLDLAPGEVRERRLALGVRPTFKTVDTCAAEFAASTPYHYSTYEDEDEVGAVHARPRHHLGVRTEPDRAGHRVRLLLRARGARAPRRRLRDDHGQLQPRDGVHRLRHRRSPLLRAGDRRGRASTCSTPRRSPVATRAGSSGSS